MIVGIVCTERSALDELRRVSEQGDAVFVLDDEGMIEKLPGENGCVTDQPQCLGRLIMSLRAPMTSFFSLKLIALYKFINVAINFQK